MQARIVLGASLPVLAVASLIGAPAAQAADINCPTAAGAYAGGTGTSGDPFLISTPGQLQLLRDTSADWNDTVRLTTDIDMGGCTWASTLGNPAIANWTGTFDGDGHAVSGLDIDIVSTSTGYAGFIAYLGTGGTVTDVGFTGDVSLTTASTGSVYAYVGGLVGFTLGSTSISKSSFTGDVTVSVTASPGGFVNPDDAGAWLTAGGLVGVLQGQVGNSFANASVTANGTATATGSGTADATALAGGLAGDVGVGSITNSYSTSTVATTLSATGGAGQFTVRRVGGAIGARSGGTMTGVVWDTTASGESSGVGLGSSTGITGLTTAQMQDVASFGPTGQNWSISEGYSQATTWGICPAYAPSYPFLNVLASPSTCPPPPPPPPPTPASAPRDVVAVAGDASAGVSWTAPSSAGSFPVTYYQAASSPGSRTCLVAAPALSCEVAGLSNGTPYTFTVRALTGAGWSPASEPSNAVTPEAAPRPSVVITGSREGTRIEVSGQTTGFGMGGTLRPWTRFPGQSAYSEGAATILVSADGAFEWGRKTGKKTYIYVQAPDGTVKSNTVTIPVR